MHEFFRSTDRVGALTRYVGNVITWNPHTFAKQLVILTCSWDYREAYSFPGKRLRYKSLTYVPKKLSDFMMSTARLVCKLAKGFFREDQVLEQFQEAFQKNLVKRERIRASEMDVDPDKRKHPYAGFSSDEEQPPSAFPPKGEKPKPRAKAPPKKAARTGGSPSGGAKAGPSGTKKDSGAKKDDSDVEELRSNSSYQEELVIDDQNERKALLKASPEARFRYFLRTGRTVYDSD